MNFIRICIVCLLAAVAADTSPGQTVILRTGGTFSGAGAATGGGLMVTEAVGTVWAGYSTQGNQMVVHGFLSDSTQRPLVVAAPEAPAIPHRFALEQNYPNPFNPTTTIRFSIPDRSKVRVEIYNLLGQVVALLIDETLEPGIHEVQFDGAPHSSGMYLCRLVAGDQRATRKIVLLK